MAFDFGGALATAIVVGVIYGVFGHGTGFLSSRIEYWKKKRWEERHKHLSSEQLQAARDNLVAANAKRSLHIWFVVFAIFFGCIIGGIAFLAKQ